MTTTSIWGCWPPARRFCHQPIEITDHYPLDGTDCVDRAGLDLRLISEIAGRR
jgi:hypothetical protein